MKIFYLLIIISLLSACKKSTAPDNRVVCPEPELSWLNAKKAEYSSCTCLTEIRQGIYKNQPVFWIGTVDPLCNGISTVYKIDGTVLITSTDKDAYQDFTTQVKDLRLYWSCSRGEKL